MYTREITITIHRPAYTQKKRKPSPLPQMLTAAACFVLAIATAVLSITASRSVAGGEKQTHDAPSTHIQTLEAQAVSYEVAQEPVADTQSGNF